MRPAEYVTVKSRYTPVTLDPLTLTSAGANFVAYRTFG